MRKGNPREHDYAYQNKDTNAPVLTIAYTANETDSDEEPGGLILHRGLIVLEVDELVPKFTCYNSGKYCFNLFDFNTDVILQRCLIDMSY